MQAATGYLTPTGTTGQTGSLVSGIYESGKLIPAGSVGIGFEVATNIQWAAADS